MWRRNEPRDVDLTETGQAEAVETEKMWSLNKLTCVEGEGTEVGGRWRH